MCLVLKRDFLVPIPPASTLDLPQLEPGAGAEVLFIEFREHQAGGHDREALEQPEQHCRVTVALCDDPLEVAPTRAKQCTGHSLHLPSPFRERRSMDVVHLLTGRSDTRASCRVNSEAAVVTAWSAPSCGCRSQSAKRASGSALAASDMGGQDDCPHFRSDCAR